MADPAPHLLAITASARERARAFRTAAPDPSSRVLSARITGTADGEYICALTLEPQTQIHSRDAVQHEGDLTIVVAGDSVDKLRGAMIDWTENRLAADSPSSTPTSPRRHRSPSQPYP